MMQLVNILCSEHVKEIVVHRQLYTLHLSVRWRLHGPPNEFSDVGGYERDGKDGQDSPKEVPFQK